MTNTAQANTDREIRVFISSTFRDMHAERDYLVSHVFPVIRRACRERQVEFTEIDLRWGVTKEEAEQGKVVRICLEEINRCRPYFLSLLGERYGWAPLDSDFDHKVELLALFPFLESSLKEGLSVTEMEILHGVMDNPDMAGHCFFYLRDNALSQSLADSLSAATDYFETEQRLQDKLAALKEKVRSSGLPLRDNYASIEALGDLIKQDLLAVLDQQFPADLTPTPLEAEQNAHRSYADDRCKAYIANPRDTEALDAHLNTKTNNALLVTGESGLGKSALLAYWVNQQRLVNPDQFIIEHYVGISGDADPVAIIRRIMAEIKLRSDDSAELPSKPEDIIQDFPLWLAKVGERDPLLLIIDGLNQLENKEGQWLPGFWQENVKAIFSVIPGEQLEAFSQREWPIHTVEALDLNRREQLIRDWLASYRKALSTEQTQRIAQAPQTGNPLFLKTVLEELRIFGYFEYLDQRITTLLTANNPQELFVLVLERLGNDFGKEIVTQIMQALWAARRGLSETEIAGISGLSRLVISTFLMAIDAHLAKRGGLLNFFHDYLRQAVKQHCFENKETETHAHIKLAHYFEQQELNDRVAEELPWQWQQAEHWEALKDCITAIPMFEVLYEKDDLELLAYWLTIGDQFDAGECYTSTLALWETETKPEQIALADILYYLGNFLIDRYVHLNSAEQLCLRSLKIREETIGTEHSDTANSLNQIARILENKGNYKKSEDFYRSALIIHEKIHGIDHLYTATLYNNLGNLLVTLSRYKEAENFLQRAITIREKNLGTNHQLTASTYNNLARAYLAQGKYKFAENLYIKALSIYDHNLGINHPETIKVRNNYAWLLQKQGRYQEAELICRHLLEIDEKILGDHPDTVCILNNLALLLQKKAHFEESEQLNRRALTIREKISGKEHSETVVCLNNLALSLQEQNKNQEAEILFRQALIINEKALGINHNAVAINLINLGQLLSILQKYTEAEMLFRRALIINENIFGGNDPNTAECFTALAGLFQVICNFKEAEDLFRRALAINEKVFGFDNTNTANKLEDLGLVLQKQNQHQEAKQLFHQALEIKEIIFGSDHLETASILNNLGWLLLEDEQYEESENLLRRALDIRKKFLGTESTKTAISLSNLAVLFEIQGNLEEAEQLFSQALHIYEKQLGKDHLHTALVLRNIGGLLRDKGQHDKAETIFKRAFDITEKSMGNAHQHTLSCIDDLADILQNRGDYEKAENYYQRALTIRKQSLGNNHSDTINNIYNLAELFNQKGDYEKAENYYRRALEFSETVYGSENTSIIMCNLAYLLENQGRYDESETLYRHALVIFDETLGADHPSTVLIRERLVEITNK